MNNIPTAEEWLKHFEENASPFDSMSDCLIEFAKFHVKEALNNVALADIEDYSGSDYIGINKQKILNAYPLENVK